MQAAVDRVMQAYGMMVNLTAEQEEEARVRLEKFLHQRVGSEHELTIQGLQFLRGNRSGRHRAKRQA